MMKHLKRFNEEYEINVKDRNFFPIEDLSRLDKGDYDIVRGYGLKMYVVNNDYEIVEWDKRDFTRALLGAYPRGKHANQLFPYLMFLKWDHIKGIKGMIQKLGELQKAYDEDIKTRFKYVMYAVQNDFSR
jgi:galactose-1-phosphate uridylyltransferase